MLSGAGPCGGKGPCPDSAESGQPTQAPGPMAAGERASLLQGKGAKGKSTNEVSQAHSARGTKGGRKLEGRLKGAAFFQQLNKLKFFYNTVERGGKKTTTYFGLSLNLVSTSSISSCADTLLSALCSTSETPWVLFA